MQQGIMGENQHHLYTACDAPKVLIYGTHFLIFFCETVERIEFIYFYMKYFLNF